MAGGQLLKVEDVSWIMKTNWQKKIEEQFYGGKDEQIVF